LPVLRRHVGSCNAIVPAEPVFVEEAPGVAQAERQAGQDGRQHSPAAQPQRDRTAVEAMQLELRQLQARRGAAVNQQQVLIGGPHQSDEQGAASSYLCQRWQLSRETKENISKGREGRHHQEGVDGGGCDASCHGSCLQRNLESGPPLIRRLFRWLNQKAAEGWWRRHQFGSFDDSGTVEHWFGQFVQCPGRGTVAGKFDDLGGGFRDGRHDPRIVCRLSQGDAGSGGGWHIVHRLAYGGGSRRLGRFGRSVKTRLRLELQLQRRIAWLWRTPASPVMT